MNFKKGIKTTVLIFTIFAGLSVFSSAMAVEGYGVVTASPSLNLRAEKIINSAKVDVIKNGEEVLINDIFGEWYNISYGDKRGFVLGEYIKITEQAKEQKIVASGGLMLRKTPNVAGETIVIIPNNEKVKTLKTSGDFVMVSYNGKIGYCSKDYVKNLDKLPTTGGEVTEKPQVKPISNESAAEKYCVANGGLNLRQEAQEGAKSLTIIPFNAKVNALGYNEVWTKVEYDGKIGYCATKYLTDLKKIEMSQEGIDKGAELVEFAKKFMGTKYVYGGETPNGFDCSGFTYYTYKMFGVSLGRSATLQMKQGIKVDRDSLQKGDLVFFTNSIGGTSIGHVGIYVGDNSFVHATSPGDVVKITKLSSAYYKARYCEARRYFK